jgi:DNA excision repair protein ERCC-4
VLKKFSKHQTAAWLMNKNQAAASLKTRQIPLKFVNFFLENSGGPMKTIVDWREKPSGIVDLMIAGGIEVQIKKMTCGDLILDGIITVERKTAGDFIVSIIDGRLFKQVANLKKNCDHPVLLIEGNPFRTGLKMSRSAIRGALLNVQTVWKVPVVYSRSSKDSVKLMQIMVRQFNKMSTAMAPRAGYRPRRLSTRQLYVLQGFPGIGPHLAKRLLNHFGSVAAVLGASSEKLKGVKGVGAVTAETIREVLDAEWSLP